MKPLIIKIDSSFSYFYHINDLFSYPVIYLFQPSLKKCSLNSHKNFSNESELQFSLLGNIKRFLIDRVILTLTKK